jgi:hypothetical protein
MLNELVVVHFQVLFIHYQLARKSQITLVKLSG